MASGKKVSPPKATANMTREAQGLAQEEAARARLRALLAQAPKLLAVKAGASRELRRRIETLAIELARYADLLAREKLDFPFRTAGSAVEDLAEKPLPKPYARINALAEEVKRLLDTDPWELGG